MKFEDYDLETIIASLCAQLRRAEANAGFLERQNAQRALESLPKPNIKPLTRKQLKEEARSIANAFGTKPIPKQRRNPRTGKFTK